METKGERSPAQKEKQEKQKWSEIASVLDIDVSDADSPELPKLPAERYLKEVLLGLQGGESDAQRHEKELLASQVQGLRELLTCESAVAVPVCTALFWLSVGIVLGRVHKSATDVFRERLAQGWYLLCLEAKKLMHKDLQARDWCLCELPFIFAQVVYRLLCDCFEEDRKHFVGQAESLINKLSLVLHFEVTGFQIMAETARKERKKLFLSRVLINPQQDLFESEAAKKKLELLESQLAVTKNRPLAFGSQDVKPMEDMQLDHVMQGRGEPRSRSPSKATQRSYSSLEVTSPSGTRPVTTTGLSAEDAAEFALLNAPAPTSAAIVLEDLSVERYDALSGGGDAMWDRHLAELSAILNPKDEDAETEDSKSRGVSEDNTDYDHSPEREDTSAPSSPQRNASPSSSQCSTQRQSPSGAKPRPPPITTQSTVPRSMMSSPGGAMSPLASTSRSGRRDAPRAVAERAPLVRQPPRHITITGGAVRWPAKSPPMKRPPPPGPWDNLLRPSEASRSTESYDEVDSPSQPAKRSRKKVRQRKVQTVAKVAALWADKHRDRKIRDVKERRAREELIVRKIGVEPLPQDVCQRELFTTWVSPIITRMADEKEQLAVLHKPQADSRHCKMQVQMPMLLRPISRGDGVSGKSTPQAGGLRSLNASRAPSRGGVASEDFGASHGSASTPTLRATGRADTKSATKTSSWAHLTSHSEQEMDTSFNASNVKFKGTGACDGGNPLSQTRRTVFGQQSMGYTRHMPKEVETRAVGGSKELVLPGHGLPRMPASGSAAMLSASSIAALVLEPPASLHSRTVESRLGEQSKAFHKTTFSQYLKDNDVFTGEPKVIFNEKRLQSEEDAALAKANVLVGGKPKRLFRLQLDKYKKG